MSNCKIYLGFKKIKLVFILKYCTDPSNAAFEEIFHGVVVVVQFLSKKFLFLPGGECISTMDLLIGRFLKIREQSRQFDQKNHPGSFAYISQVISTERKKLERLRGILVLN